MSALDAVSGSGDYSNGGNFLPHVDGSFVHQLVDVKYKDKAGKKQKPAYFFKFAVQESDNVKVVKGRKYDFMIGLWGDHDSGLKRLVSCIAAFAGVSQGTPFKASDYLTEDGKGKWIDLANQGKLEAEGLIAAHVRQCQKYKQAVLKDGQAVVEERDGTDDKFFAIGD